jgi:hypothetical protein
MATNTIPASCRKAVVVVQAAEYGQRPDRTVDLRRSRDGLLMHKCLMTTRFVVEAHVLGHEAPEMILAEDEDVIEQLS